MHCEKFKIFVLCKSSYTKFRLFDNQHQLQHSRKADRPILVYVFWQDTILGSQVKCDIFFSAQADHSARRVEEEKSITRI